MPGADWNADNRNYTVKIRFTAPPQGSDHFVPEAGNNTFYAGTLKDGSPNKVGLIGYRIYVPSISYDKLGGVGLPKITYCAAEKDCRNTNIAGTVNKTTLPENPLTPANVFNDKHDKNKCYC